eukprot:464075-Prymnesium_polylepis.1
MNNALCTTWCRAADRGLGPTSTTCAGLAGVCPHLDSAVPIASAAASRRYGGERVALCLTGNARTFARPHVHTSIKYRLVRALRASIDVFASISLEDDGQTVRYPGSAPNPKVAVSAREFGQAIAAIEPRAVQLIPGDGQPAALNP